MTTDYNCALANQDYMLYLLPPYLCMKMNQYLLSKEEGLGDAHPHTVELYKGSVELAIQIIVSVGACNRIIGNP